MKGHATEMLVAEGLAVGICGLGYTIGIQEQPLTFGKGRLMSGIGIARLCTNRLTVTVGQ